MSQNFKEWMILCLNSFLITRRHKMKVLFLDIDGVLNGHKQKQNNFCGIDTKCVNHLNTVMLSVPDLQIVLSSSWRYMIAPSTMTLRGFEYMLLVCGVCCRGQLLDSTVKDETVPERADQVKEWLDRHPEVTKHLALDDMDWEFGKRKVVSLRTDPRVGLTEIDADQIVKYFNQV